MRGVAPREHPVHAALYDLLVVPQDWLGLRRQRARVAREARGNVLEIGVGTGLNLPHYAEAASVVAIDPDSHMLRRARRRARKTAVPVELVQASAEELPFPDASFDTVVVTLALCTVEDPAGALREVRRVLKPDGRLVFLEHVRAATHRLARTQDRLAPAWKRLSGGCHLNRTTVETIEREGFELERVWRSRNGVLVQGTAVLDIAGRSG